VPRERLARLLEAERRLSQDLAVEVEANQAYHAYRAGGRMRDGRRFGKPPAMWVAPEEPTGEINLTDPDSRNMLETRGFMQGYNAQAAVNEQHVVLLAEICVVKPDFGNLEHRFHRRGRSAVRSEWRLITATHNLLRLHHHRITAQAA
jgi:hypothetical protein